MRDVVHVCQDAESLALHARHWLIDQIDRHFANPDTDWNYSIALAGGATPMRLYELLAELPDGKIDWKRIVLLWGDERNVPADHPDSNYNMVKTCLLDRISIPAENILAVPNPGGDPVEAALEYEKILQEKIPGRPRKFPRIDCVFLGMGTDIHTASLFPGTEALNEKSRVVVANHVPQLNCTRITLTPPMINAARHVAFFINGAKKKEALSMLWHAPRDTNRLPAQLIRPRDGSLSFFLDKAAMGDIPLPETVMVQML
jgi:6-phosphogluconolactonase